MSFCLCWDLVLEARLQQETRMELRKWLSKASSNASGHQYLHCTCHFQVVLRCVSMVTTTTAVDTRVVAMAANLIARILIIPHQVLCIS